MLFDPSSCVVCEEHKYPLSYPNQKLASPPPMHLVTMPVNSTFRISQLQQLLSPSTALIQATTPSITWVTARVSQLVSRALYFQAAPVTCPKVKSRGAWVVRMVECLTLGFCSSHDLGVVGSSPQVQDLHSSGVWLAFCRLLLTPPIYMGSKIKLKSDHTTVTRNH